MEPCKGYKPRSDVRHFSTGGKLASIGDIELISMDQQPNMNVCLKQQTSAKPRKTALQFFRIRKGFFTIPALFGDSKRQKKCSKKEIRKSRTHDGLCKTIYKDNLKGVPEDCFKNKHHKDWVEHIPERCCEFGQNAKDQKSWSLPRPKRGLRGLFNSIRQHKKNQNVDFERNKMIAISFPHDKQPDILNEQDISNQSEIQRLKGLCNSNVPDLATETSQKVTPSFNIADVIVFENNMDRQQSLTNETCEMVRYSEYPDRFIKNSAENVNSCTLLRSSTEDCSLNFAPSDQISLNYGDVESLKSFDSLTGCGDITADQDGDSISESNVSDKISRSLVKRSSCHVTYQGGGEEMAGTFEFDENCFQHVWGKEVPKQIYLSCNKSQYLLEQRMGSMTTKESSTFKDYVPTDDGFASLKSLDTIANGNGFNSKSTFNSKEVYYDSPTQGSDYGRHVQLDRIMSDRAHINNYSGDAFYESRADDDSLISPPSIQRSISVSHKYLKDPADLSRHPVFSHEIGRLQGENTKLHEIPKNFFGSKGMQNQLKCQPDELSLNTQLVDDADDQAQMNEKHVIPLYFNQRGNTAQGLHFPNKICLNQSRFANCEKRQSNPTNVRSDFNSPEEPYQSEIKSVLKTYRHVDDSKFSRDSEENKTISFSQVLVDFTKHSNLFSTSNNCTACSDISAPFSQNMDALPAIVTFDVVNMHNEGQYDQQIDDCITSPYQSFDENRILEFNRNVRAIASLPRNISLTGINPSMSSPLALGKKSRSLDTSIDFGIPGICLGNRSTLRQCTQMNRQKGPLSVTAVDRNITGVEIQPCTAKVRSAVCSDLFCTNVLQPLNAIARSESILCNVISENTHDLKDNDNISLSNVFFSTSFDRSRISRDDLHVRSDSGIIGGGEGLFYTSDFASKFCGQHSKNRPVGITQGMPNIASPISSCFPKSDIHLSSKGKKPIDSVPCGFQ